MILNGKAQESQVEAITKPQNNVDIKIGVCRTKNEHKTFTQNETSYQNSTRKKKSNAKEDSNQNQQSRPRFAPNEINVRQQSDTFK